MTEWLLVLLVFLIVLGIVAYTYHKQIMTAWFMYQTFRKFRQQVKPKQTKQVPKKDTTKDTPLVRCPKCSKWTPQDEAVKLKSNFYCSHACMEKAMSFNN
jgi:hypothetical protein